MSKNKTFKVIWEVHVEREQVEAELSKFDEYHEGDVHDRVYWLALDKFDAGAPDVSRLEDENGNPIRRRMEHHLDSHLSGAVAFEEYKDFQVNNWEELLDKPSKESGE